MSSDSSPSPSTTTAPTEEEEEDKDVVFQKRLDKVIEIVKQWHSTDASLVQKCRSSIPFSDLATNPKYHREDDQYYEGSALFLKRLCYYFQQDVMTWVNKPICEGCNTSDHQEYKGMRPSTAEFTEEEKDGMAKRVELYECMKCQTTIITTFPRYNSIAKLMETRKGRCGEYANLFGYYCVCVGFETRFIWDATDHVWVECWCYNSKQDGWIMADPCEGIINKPSMYESGWNKQSLSYQIGVTIDSITDVSSRYTRKVAKDEEEYYERRRQVCSSEAISEKLIQDANQRLQQGLSEKRRAELQSRAKFEAKQFAKYKQAREWTEEEKHDKGRLSGSLAWKLERKEAGKSFDNAVVEGSKGQDEEEGDEKKKKKQKEENDQQQQQQEEEAAIHAWDVEMFYPNVGGVSNERMMSITVSSNNNKKIVVSGANCGLYSRPKNNSSINVVVVDEKYLGCILQSRSFGSWIQVANFCTTLPTNRIVALSSSSSLSLSIEKHIQESLKRHLGNFPDITDSSAAVVVLYIGQVRAEPEWTISKVITMKQQQEASSSEPTTTTTNNDDDSITSIQVTIKKKASTTTTTTTTTDAEEIVLKTESNIVPRRIYSRLPESILPLSTQLVATPEQKRKAFEKFFTKQQETNNNKDSTTTTSIVGYTTKPGVPIYLLGPSSFPFERLDDYDDDSSEWKTSFYLPQVLVVPHVDEKKNETAISFDIPVANDFFTNLFGPTLLINKGSDVTTTLPTTTALENTRLVGLYFSAHWCGPCRHFTPILSVLYEHLKEQVPKHGMEIVFISSDRDVTSFQHYYGTMPWLSVPYHYYNNRMIQNIKMQYGVRGIPSFIVLDSISGQIVVQGRESRGEVTQACRMGDDGMEAMLESWLQRVPADTQEMIRLLQVSIQEDKLEEEEVVTAVNEKREEHPYCVRDIDNDKEDEQQPPAASDPAALIKQVFTKLVADGADPNSAAAQAIQMVSSGQVLQAPSSFGKGNLHDGIVEWNKAETTTTTTTTAVKQEEEPTTTTTISNIVKQALVITNNNATDIEIVISTLMKYLDNVIREPSNPKFRTIKLSNKIADRITRLDSGLELAETIFGFHLFASYQDFYLSIPLDANLKELKALLVNVGEEVKKGGIIG